MWGLLVLASTPNTLLALKQQQRGWTLLCWQLYVFFISLNLHNRPEIYVSSTFLTEMEKNWNLWRLKFTHNHRARKWQSWILNSGLSNLYNLDTFYCFTNGKNSQTMKSLRWHFTFPVSETAGEENVCFVDCAHPWGEIKIPLFLKPTRPTHPMHDFSPRSTRKFQNWLRCGSWVQ